MEDTDDIHHALCEPVYNQMPPDMERPVPRWQLTRAMPQRWIILKRQQGIIEQRGVAVVLLFAPRAKRHTQNILVIGLRLIRDNERVIRTSDSFLKMDMRAAHAWSRLKAACL